jgi:hypothetical protein
MKEGAMRMRILAVCLVCLLVAIGVGAQGRKVTAEGAEHDFGAKVVLVSTRSPDGKGDVGGGFLVKAKVRRLGDRYFVVGQLADVGEGFKESRRTVVWFPLSEIIQLSEYDSVESARRIVAEMRKADKRK